MNVIIYTRVSTEEQVKGYSLTSQQKACEEFCHKNGWTVDTIFEEQGESAKTVNRTKLAEMLAYCSNNKGKVDILLVHKLDRIARNTTDHTAIRAQLLKYDIVLRSVSENIDESPGGKLMENVFAAVAQFDNEVRGQRAQAGMKERVKQGLWAWPAPFGYINENNMIVPDETRAPLITLGFELYAEGIFTNSQIAKKLNARGLRSRSGRKLLPQDISKMLSNKVYMGVIDVRKKWGFETEGAHQAIVSKEMFLKVQGVKQRHSNNTPVRSLVNPDFVLKNVACCPECGGRLTGSKSKGHSQYYAYYHCKKCRAPSIKKAEIEDAFARSLKTIQLKRRLNRLLVESIADVWKENQKDNRASLKHINGEIKALELKKDKLLDKLADGILSDLDYKRVISKIDDSLAVKELERSDARDSQVSLDYCKSLSETLLNNVLNLWQEAPVEYKLEFQKLIFPKGFVYADENVGTAEIGLPFNLISTSATKKELLVSRLSAHWNQFILSLGDWDKLIKAANQTPNLSVIT